MRFPEPPRGKGGVRCSRSPLSASSRRNRTNCAPCLSFPAGKGLEALLAAGEKQTESYGERSCSCWLQLWDVQPGFGVRSLLSSEHGLLSQACSWTEMVSCLLSWLLQQQP